MSILLSSAAGEALTTLCDGVEHGLTPRRNSLRSSTNVVTASLDLAETPRALIDWERTTEKQTAVRLTRDRRECGDATDAMQGISCFGSANAMQRTRMLMDGLSQFADVVNQKRCEG